MAQQVADRRDVDFVLHEQFEAETLQQYSGYGEFNKKTIDMVISEARNFAIKEILPTFTEGDRVGAVFDAGEVKIPACFHRPYSLLRENDWTALTAPPDLGGQGLPYLVAQAANEYLIGANPTVGGLCFLAHAAGEMIEIFGTEAQKTLFLRNMYTGRWGGTMVLTEPEAGSDLGNLTTSAKKNPDGTYTITGNKIFISGGEQDFTENIIHPVLARIEGAPPGTRGISIFIVPKIWVNDDGSLGEPNDVVCTGIEKKMGLHASPTCSLSFGSRGQCRGLLLGEENRGMKIMFHMMNDARLYVGSLGLANASPAYLYALDYARQRRQGRDLEQMMNPEAPSVPIIRHSDVRRMLLWMKVHVEGMRSLVYFGAYCVDIIKKADSEETRDHYQGLLDLLTPIIKAYCSEKGVAVCNEAMQVYGGYGYTMEYPVEQLLRDSRIGPIYEGTNGIQAMDLLARKLGMNNGQVFMSFIQEIQKVTARAKETPHLAKLGEQLDAAVNTLGGTALRLGGMAMSPKFKTAFAHALPFLDAMGDVTMAWMLLWRATAAATQLERLVGSLSEEKRREKIEKNKNAAFYEGQVQSATYFIRAILPVTLGKLGAIKDASSAIVDIPEMAFGS